MWCKNNLWRHFLLGAERRPKRKKARRDLRRRQTLFYRHNINKHKLLYNWL